MNYHARSVHSHNHSRNCSKSKDVDLAALQSQAFKFMILQKPKVKKSTPASISRPYQASFLPDNKMSEELELAFH